MSKAFKCESCGFETLINPCYQCKHDHVEKRQTDVHTEHCCVHCCKYGDDEKCTVVSGKLKQSFKCSQIEFCGKLTDEEVKDAFAKGVERSYTEDEVKLLVNVSCEAVIETVAKYVEDACSGYDDQNIVELGPSLAKEIRRFKKS